MFPVPNHSLIYGHSKVFLFDIGIEHSSFKAACLARHIIMDNTQVMEALDEVVATAMPRNVRKFLALFLIHCEVPDTTIIWEKYHAELISDFLQRGLDEETARHMALQEIDRELRLQGSALELYPGFPMVDFSVEAGMEPVDLESIHRREASLNDDQRVAYEAILAAVESRESLAPTDTNFFLDGPGS